MSKQPRRVAGTAGNTQVRKFAMQSFAERLLDARVARGLSQSALAREIWGETEDSRGYKVARNRDRISSYEGGKSVPEPHNLQKIADVLGLSVEELAPDLVAQAVDAAEPEVSINMVPGGEGYVHLRVNILTDMDTAMKVGALLAKNPYTKSILAKSGQ